MPFGDRTGPMGQGPMTGRGLGYCSGSGSQGYADPGFRRGFGLGRGFRRGRGFGRRFFGYGQDYPYPSQISDKKEEIEILKDEASVLEEELKAIDFRVGELEGNKKKK